jgi:hypothetical protein
MSHQEDQIRIHKDEAQAMDGLLKNQKPKRKWPKHWKKFTELESLIIQTVKTGCLTSKGISNALDLENSSTFRSKLADLVERLILIKTRNGYQLNK